MRIFRQFLASLALILVIAGPAAATGGPVEVVERYHDTILAVMKNAETLGFSGRYEWLEPVIREVYDLPRMAHAVTGRYWDTMTAQERERFTEVFTAYVVATTAHRFSGYSGQRFETLEQKEMGAGRVVLSRIVKANGESIAINYLLVEGSAGWHVADVYLDGSISELAQRRSEFVSVLQRSGLDGLIATLARITDELASE